VSGAEQAPCRLVVVRHGSTPWSSAGKHTGRTDVPLDERGRAQGRALAGRLGGARFVQVLCSPLRRARDTCALAGFSGRALACDDLLEWDYGEYEGMTSDEIRSGRPGWNLWDDGVPGGESIEEVAGRADRVIGAVRRAGGDTLAFAHGHLLRVLAARWLGWAPQTGRALALAPAGLGVLSFERGAAILGRWNDDGEDPLAER
jgi:broad specificity phosphatase PhoE